MLINQKHQEVYGNILEMNQNDNIVNSESLQVEIKISWGKTHDSDNKKMFQ